MQPTTACTTVETQAAFVKQLKTENAAADVLAVEVAKLKLLKSQNATNLSPPLAAIKFDRTTLEDLLKRRFFYTSSFQIYGGTLFDWIQFNFKQVFRFIILILHPRLMHRNSNDLTVESGRKLLHTITPPFLSYFASDEAPEKRFLIFMLGVSGLYDYGPPGTALQNNLIDCWRWHHV